MTCQIEHIPIEASHPIPEESALPPFHRSLIRALRENRTLSVLQEETDAAYLAHLSPIRQNLLEWMAFRPDERVLEWNGQTGLLTALLCRRAAHVTSVVTSVEDACVHAVRNRDCAGLSLVVVDDPADEGAEEPGERVAAEQGSADEGTGELGERSAAGGSVSAEDERRYDCVTMIGMTRNFYRALTQDAATHDSAAQYRRLIERAAAHLLPHGRLLLAVNNRFGLQYWAGKTDACSAGLFDTIQGDTDGQAEYSISHGALEKLLRDAGFRETAFYYPIPDYRFPESVFSAKRLPQVGDIRPTSHHYGRERYQLFDENAAFDTLCREGLFPQFANSFFVEARL